MSTAKITFMTFKELNITEPILKAIGEKDIQYQLPFRKKRFRLHWQKEIY